VIKFLFGLLSFIMGITILAWCVYSFLVPNAHFHPRGSNLPGLFMPPLFLYFGWSWMRGETVEAAPKPARLEVIVTLKLSNAEFGTHEERQTILDLKHRLEARLEEKDLGEIDGEEFGGGECCIFVQTDDPERATRLIRQLLDTQPSLKYTISDPE
jgi:hypothetical protein